MSPHPASENSGIWKLIFGRLDWSSLPLHEPIVVGTLTVVFFATLVAVPVGLSSAIYLSEYASPRVRRIVKPILEVLEGLPTVAIGLFAFAVLTPLIRQLTPFLPWTGPFSIGVAGITVGLLIIPLVSLVSDDAMRSVPADLRQGAYAMGATKYEVALKVIVPAAISGIIAAFVLGISRAIGETMVVLLVAGAGSPVLSFDPTKCTQTMTAYIGSTATGDIAQGTITYDSIFAVGVLLFLMTLAMNILAIRLVKSIGRSTTDVGLFRQAESVRPGRDARSDARRGGGCSRGHGGDVLQRGSSQKNSRDDHRRRTPAGSFSCPNRGDRDGRVGLHRRLVSPQYQSLHERALGRQP